MGVACEKSSTSFSPPVVLAGDRAEKTQSSLSWSPMGSGCFPYLVLRCWCARTVRRSLGSKLPGTEIMQQ